MKTRLQHNCKSLLACILASLVVLCVIALRVQEDRVQCRAAAEETAVSSPGESPPRAEQLAEVQSETLDVRRIQEPPRTIRLPAVRDDHHTTTAPAENYPSTVPAERFGSRVAAAEMPDFNDGAPSYLSRGAAPTADVLPAELAGTVEHQPPAMPEVPIEQRTIAEEENAVASLPRRRPSAGSVPPSDTAPKPTDRADEADPLWKQSDRLLERLAPLVEMQETGQWASDADRLLRRLAETKKSEPVDPVLSRLQESLAMVASTSSSIRDPSLKVELRHTGHALQRRVDVWRGVALLDGDGLGEDDLPAADERVVRRCLDQIDKLTGASPEGSGWRKYILFDELREWDRQRGKDDRLPRELARRVTQRMTATSLSIQQRKIFSIAPMAALLKELQKSAAKPVEAASLLDDLERYETSGLPSDGQLVARDCRYLAMSSNPRHRALAGCIEHYYRGANLRVAVSEDLLNRLIPNRDLEYAPVNDTIMGHPIHGRSLTSTEVVVKLNPDPRRVMMGLEITGQVVSLTHSDSGMAVFYNDNQAGYTATKPLQFDLDGIHLQPAKISVYSNTQLRGLKTGLDGVPLFGSLAEGVARSQHEQKRREATAEIKHKVARKARTRVDSESRERLGKVSRKLKNRVIMPLDAMLLNPLLVGAQTTEQRFNMRLRVAGEDQLGASTPRPWAPSDSLASFQIHQSAVNNLLDRLNLAGRTFTMPELAKHVSKRLSLTKPWETNPAHDDVKISFAEKDPVVVSLQNGQATLSLSIVRMSKSSRVWKNFCVRAVYRPNLDGRSAELVRDGVIHLKGKRLSTGSQIALRAVFSKTFSQRHPLPLSTPRLATDPNLADLGITQVAIDDGWLGLALGPGRTAGRPLPMR